MVIKPNEKGLFKYTNLVHVIFVYKNEMHALENNPENSIGKVNLQDPIIWILSQRRVNKNSCYIIAKILCGQYYGFINVDDYYLIRVRTNSESC